MGWQDTIETLTLSIGMPSNRARIRAYQIISNAAEKAGTEKGRRHPHVFRHGFAVNAVLSGVPPMVLRRWMGHASMDTTLIYTEVLAQDTKEYLRRMNF